MAQGELRAVIGPNGAGKTTLFNMISGFFPPSSGRVLLDGEPINDVTAQKRVRRGIVRTFQITEIFHELSVRENVRVAVETQERLNGRPWLTGSGRAAVERRVDELLGTTGLAAKADRVASELAHGDQRVVEVAIALAMRPRLLLLDEPTAGMGPEETKDMVALLERLAEKRTVLLVEHKMKMVLGLSKRVVVLHHGRLLADGPPDEIRSNPEVRRVYLGQSEGYG
jgi:branched-chain amino acid transport system ATP-binding protein